MDADSGKLGGNVTRRYVTAPAYVAACDLGPATVLVNYLGGGTHTLIGPSARWWAELSVTGDLNTPTSIDPSLARQLLHQLRRAGLLLSTVTPKPWPSPIFGQPWSLSFGTQEVENGRVILPRVPGQFLVLAGLALVLTLAIRHIGGCATSMHRVLRALRWAACWTDRTATVAEVRQVVHAVRRVGQLVPGRVACLEESAAVVLTLAMSRRGVTWCHGVAADPVRLHAWVEVNREPVAEPSSTLRYTTLRTVPDRN